MNQEDCYRKMFLAYKGKYEYIKAHTKICPVTKLCKALKISRSGYYAWLTRKISKRDKSNQILARKLIELHEMYPVYGLDSLYHIVRKQIPCLRVRVHRLMKSYNIHSVRYKSSVKHRYVGHNLPVKDNLLQQSFHIKFPNTVWVGDITYLMPTEQPKIPHHNRKKQDNMV